MVSALVVLATLLWAAWAIAIPFDGDGVGGGPLCIGTPADLAQQAGAVVGVAFAAAAVWASSRKALRTWAYLTLAAGVVFIAWYVGTHIAANANC